VGVDHISADMYCLAKTSSEHGSANTWRYLFFVNPAKGKGCIVDLYTTGGYCKFRNHYRIDEDGKLYFTTNEIHSLETLRGVWIGMKKHRKFTEDKTFPWEQNNMFPSCYLEIFHD